MKQDVAWASLAVPDGGGVLEAEREEGDREMVLWILTAWKGNSANSALTEF